MKKIKLKKLSCTLLTVIMLFTAVFSASIIKGFAATYTPRLSAPSTTNKYYYSDINIFYKIGLGMPNCTAYAFGRAYEILKTEPMLCHYGAGEWYDYNKTNKYYKYGSTPKLGAIACWNHSGGGHVAVVEEIKNGQITFSNSGWGYKNFYLTYASTSDSTAGGSSNWNFQGYIYIGEFEAADTSYKTGIYKTNVDDWLNMRSGAGTSYSVVTQIPDNKNLTVTKISNNWGYTTYNSKSGWVCLDYCDYVSAIPTTQPTTVAPTTVAPTTAAPTTVPPTTIAPTTVAPTTIAPTTVVETTAPITVEPTTRDTVTQPATEASTEPLPVFGDINGDGILTIQDATFIQYYLVGGCDFSAEQMILADINGDGSVNVIDATCIQQILVGDAQ